MVSLKCLTVILTLVLALPALAGHAECPGLTTVPAQAAAPGIMPNGATTPGDIPNDLREIVVGVIEGMLSVP
jgi:hypothetical protein